MYSLLSNSIEVFGTPPDDVEFKFPIRDLGPFRTILWVTISVLMGLSVVIIAVPTYYLVRDNFAVQGIAMFVVFLFFPTLIVRFPIWFCLCGLFGHGQVELRGRSLRSSEGIGSWRRTKTWPISVIKRLQIVDVLPAIPLTIERNEFADCLHFLTGVLDDNKRVVIVPLYPRSLLDAFVEELSKQLSAIRDTIGTLPTAQIDEREIRDSEKPNGMVQDETQISFEQVQPDSRESTPTEEESSAIKVVPPIGLGEIVAELPKTIEKLQQPDIFEQPLDSDVIVERFSEGITLRVPPIGVWSANAGLFTGGIICLVVTLGFTILFAAAGMSQGAGFFGSIGLSILMMSIFWLGSAVMLYQGWKIGTREYGVAVIDDTLIVMKTEFGRTRKFEWPTNEISSVRVGESGIEVNDEEIPELQIHGAKGKLHSMLLGRKSVELQWMATLLRQTLQIS
jgi:hypothetical protein